ncbi:MAG: 2-amino-4-hydroxy-6-hydroxymethyldihydropteridine diphosphokinase [Planctomycetota bacterium]
MMPIACISLGSNLGDRAAHINAALRRLDALTPDVRLIAVSSLHETKAVGPGQQPNYLNAAAMLETTLSPHDLLASMLEIEKQHGRERSIRWAARTLDLDLLLYDDAIIDDPPTLTVPHPMMHDRSFVLDPLVEIAGDLVHPVFGKTIRELQKQCHGGT